MAGRVLPSRRARRVLLAVAAVALLAAAALVLPTAAFHVLPPGVTGEAGRLASLLAVGSGQTIAEIGAGAGALTVEMARRVGAAGRVYSTELSAERRDDIRARIARAGVGNVVVVEAGPAETNLPDACCQAIFMRNVYHHIGEPDTFNASLRLAIRNDGWLAIIDFEPGAFWRLFGPPSDSAAERTGHGVPRRALVAELTRAGFRVERQINDWGGRLFLVLFRASARPEFGASTRSAEATRLYP